jgi:hypothetical protein
LDLQHLYAFSEFAHADTSVSKTGWNGICKLIDADHEYFSTSVLTGPRNLKREFSSTCYNA